jgi:hypothetical protein
MITAAVFISLTVVALISLRFVLGPGEMRLNGKVISEPQVTRAFSHLATHELETLRSVDVQLDTGAVVNAHIGTKEPIAQGTPVSLVGLRANWFSPRCYSIVRARRE